MALVVKSDKSEEHRHELQDKLQLSYGRMMNTHKSLENEFTPPLAMQVSFLRFCISGPCLRQRLTPQ